MLYKAVVFGNTEFVFISDREFKKAEERFRENFESRHELGASVSIWQQGEEVFNLASGWCEREKERAWTDTTLVPIYSATKGPAAATLLLLLEKSGLSPLTRVREIWDTFPIEEATIAELLSHRCGLAALDRAVSVFDFEAVIDAIEHQARNWPLGSAHGYHPRTFGFLLDKLSLLLSGEKIGSQFDKLIAVPLGLEMWIGLPEAQFPRVATLYPGKMAKEDLLSDFYKDFNTEGSLVKRTFASPHGLQAVQEMNTPAAWTSALPAMGGLATAQALAKFYQACIGEIVCFSRNVRQWMSTRLVSGDDLILKTPTSFSCGFQFDPIDAFGKKFRSHYGSSNNAFGHPGAGGSHAFGDPDTGLSFAYTMNQMELDVLPNEKCISMVRALYGE